MDELDDPVTSMLDGIPIVGHIKALIYKIRGQRNLSVSAYIAATHNTFVSGFGVLGGYLAGITGSCVGGVIGGLFVDIPINLVATRYNYVDLPRNWNLSKYSGFDLISLVAKDAFTGLLASVVCNGYMIPMLSLNDSENGNGKDYNTFIEETAGDMSGSVHVIRIQKDMCGIIYMYLRRMEKETEKECYSNECEKVVVLKDTAYRDLLTIPKLLIVDTPKAIQIPVNNISQLQPGDHIVYKRWRVLDFNVYDHHAIVGEVFLKKGKYTVYEQAPYSNRSEYRSRGKAWIKEIEKPFETNLIYKIDHRKAAKPREDVRKTGHFICHHASPKVFGKKYNVVLNNCEHFANFCATGLRESQQVQKPTTTVIPVCLGFILSAITIATGTADIVLLSLYLVFDYSVRAMVSHNNPLSILLRYIRATFRPAQNAIEQ